MDGKKTKIFISYSHKNRDVCDRIAEIFQKQESLDVWYDKGLIPGEIYRKKIVEVIKECDYFNVLISNDSVQSEWVLDEVEYAKKMHKKILPIWIENTELSDDLDMILQRYHSLFWHLRSSDSQFEKSLLSMVDEKEEEVQGQSLEVLVQSTGRRQNIILKLRNISEMKMADSFSWK